MDILSINSVCGLYNELYTPNTSIIKNAKININKYNNYLDANGLYWADIFSPEKVKNTVQLLINRYREKEFAITTYEAIVADPDGFEQRVHDAKIHIADLSNNPQDFYAYIETLNIYCRLYAQINFPKYSFNIQQSWMLFEDSAEQLYDYCLHEEKNPYLSFIKTHILPIINKLNPKVIFLLGRPGYFTFALARLLKNEDLSLFLCVSRHSSEYFSLNKIDRYLVHNTFFFKSIDAVILDYFPETEKAVADAVLQKRSVANIANIIYKNNEGIICQSNYQSPGRKHSPPIVQLSPKNQDPTIKISPCSIANVHLFPYIKCYWNKCNFCGINQKYHFENSDVSYDSLYAQFDKLKNLIDQGITHIWFIDEAIPPDGLLEIAKYFIQEKNNVTWQARCRIDRGLLEHGLPETLAQSGLRELRMGLESGSMSVLKRMNKFDDDFSFELLDEICCQYTDVGISIHFPVIIGFPGETEDDRILTYELLRRLTQQYCLVTFNINIFGLDISSKVFRNWSDFDIQSIMFPCKPSYFLGNILHWNSDFFILSDLERQRDQIMRELLYPWMPSKTLTPPHIFYRLSETIRNTLFWKEKSIEGSKKTDNYISNKYVTADLTIFYSESKKMYLIYSWQSHHYMLGNSVVVDILSMFQTPKSVSDVVNDLQNREGSKYEANDMNVLISKFISHRYLTKIHEQ